MIDWSRVTELREEIGAEDFAEITELFLTEVEEVVEKLGAAPDLNCLCEDLHFLKGSALNLGFQSFSELCQIGETASGQGQADSVDIAALLTCYGESKSAFLTELETRFPS